MKMYLLALGAAAAVSAAAPASAYMLVPMGTLSATNPQVSAGNDPNDTSSRTQHLTDASSFDLAGAFNVAADTQAAAFSTQLVASGILSDLTANIYTHVQGGRGALVANVPAVYSNANAWIFQSPVSFSLGAGQYLFEVTGNKTAGAVLQYQLAVTAVPLPGAALMFGAGLLVVGGLAARRKQIASQAI